MEASLKIKGTVLCTTNGLHAPKPDLRACPFRKVTSKSDELHSHQQQQNMHLSELIEQ